MCSYEPCVVCNQRVYTCSVDCHIDGAQLIREGKWVCSDGCWEKAAPGFWPGDHVAVAQGLPSTRGQQGVVIGWPEATDYAVIPVQLRNQEKHTYVYHEQLRHQHALELLAGVLEESA